MKISAAAELIGKVIDHNSTLEGGRDNEYLVPYLASIPGLGKSSIVKQETVKRDMEFRCVIFAQFDAGELGGFPIVDGDKYKRAKPFFMDFEPGSKGVLFVDELPQSPVANQNVAAQLCLERRIGEHLVPDGWTIIAAGNPLSSRAGTNAMPSHLKDRLMHLEIEPDTGAFREYALANNFVPEITAYLNERPEWLSKFDPKADVCPSPRSWEKANTVIGMKLDPNLESKALQGVLGEGTVADFTGYLRVWRDLPKVESVLAEPKTHEIPQDPSILYALCSSLAHHANSDNIKNLVTFIKRFENKEFAAFCMKDTISRDPSLKTNKVVTDWFLKEGRQLML